MNLRISSSVFYTNPNTGALSCKSSISLKRKKDNYVEENHLLMKDDMPLTDGIPIQPS